MTAEITGSAIRPDAGPSNTAQLFDELKSTTDAVRNKDWMSGGLGGASPGLDILGSVSSPLSALSNSGMGFITASVSFLEEPLQQLVGDPGSISSGAQTFQAAGQAVSSIADSYQQSIGPETSGWSGDAAAGYVKTGEELVGGLAALGEASRALAEGTAGAGEVVAKTLQEVTTLVNEATGKIIMIVNQALAAAQATFGASVAAAIPQAVQVAVEYGGRITGKMQELLSSTQNLMGHVQSAAQAVAKVTDTISQISERCQQATGTSALTTPSGSGESSRPASAPAASGESGRPESPVGATVPSGSVAGSLSASGTVAASHDPGRPLSAPGTAGTSGDLGRPLTPAGTTTPNGSPGSPLNASGTPSFFGGAPRPTTTPGGEVDHRNNYHATAENVPDECDDRREPPQTYA